VQFWITGPITQLRPKTREWEGVVKLFCNAVVFLQSYNPSEGRVILEEAEGVYYHHNQTRNRIQDLSVIRRPDPNFGRDV